MYPLSSLTRGFRIIDPLIPLGFDSINSFNSINSINSIKRTNASVNNIEKLESQGRIARLCAI